MKNNLTCEVVEDLLPSYVDDLTNEVTNTAIREHMTGCEKCKSKLDTMKSDFGEERLEAEKKEIDFLKKTRRKNIKTVVISVVAIVMAVLIVVLALPFTGNEMLRPSDVYYNLEVQDNHFKLTLRPVSNEMTVKAVVKESFGLGVKGVDVRGRKKSIFESGRNYVWENTYDNITSFVFFDRILWEDGEYISPITSAAYAVKDPYIGDMSHNSQVAAALMMRDYLGTFENKLTTAKEPYGWELIFKNFYLESQKEEKETLMKNYAYVLMGVIGNLGEVSFTYEVLDSNGDHIEHHFKVTKKQATNFFGEDIKNCMQDVNTLQRLIEKTGLDTLPYINQTDSQSFRAEIDEQVILNVLNTSDEKITKVTARCKETDETCAHGFQKDGFNLDLPDFFGEDSVGISTFSFDLENLSENLYSEERLGKVHFQLEVEIDYDETYVVENLFEASAAFGAVYDVVLSGNVNDGFTLKGM